MLKKDKRDRKKREKAGRGEQGVALFLLCSLARRALGGAGSTQERDADTKRDFYGRAEVFFDGISDFLKIPGNWEKSDITEKLRI